MFASFAILFIFLAFLNGFRRDASVANEHYESVWQRQNFWKKLAEIEAKSGRPKLAMSGYKNKHPVVDEKKDSREGVREEYMTLRYRLPSMMRFRRWEWIVIRLLGTIYFVSIILSTVFYYSLRIQNRPLSTYCWMCHLSLRLIQQIQYRVAMSNVTWCSSTNASTCPAELCVLDASAEMMTGQRNMTALFFDQAHHNVHRMYYNETTPRVGSLCIGCMYVLAAMTAGWRLLYKGGNRIFVRDQRGETVEGIYIASAQVTIFAWIVLFFAIAHLGLIVYVFAGKTLSSEAYSCRDQFEAAMRYRRNDVFSFFIHNRSLITNPLFCPDDDVDGDEMMNW
ncbi:unnamed protein product, partial [Mesorhabditis spiculigera]